MIIHGNYQFCVMRDIYDDAGKWLRTKGWMNAITERSHRGKMLALILERVLLLGKCKVTLTGDARYRMEFRKRHKRYWIYVDGDDATPLAFGRRPTPPRVCPRLLLAVGRDMELLFSAKAA
jgi:hypothetical protein